MYCSLSFLLNQLVCSPETLLSTNTCEQERLLSSKCDCNHTLDYLDYLEYLASAAERTLYFAITVTVDVHLAAKSSRSAAGGADGPGRVVPQQWLSAGR